MIFNRTTLNSVPLNSFRDFNALDFSENMAVSDAVLLSESITFLESIIEQETLATFYSLVLRESVLSQSHLVTNNTISLALLAGIEIADEYQVMTVLELSSAFVHSGTLAISGDIVLSAAETLVVSGTCDTKLRALVALSDALAFVSRIDSATAYVIAESLGIDAALVVNSNVVMGMLSTLAIQGSSETTLSAVLDLIEPVIMSGDISMALRGLMAISEAVAMEAESDSAVAIAMLEALGLSADAALTSQVVFSALESMVLTGAAVSTAVLALSPTESLAIDESMDAAAIFGLAFQEGIEFAGVLNTPEGEFTAWVLNAKTKAPWQYDNFPFNSFASHAGRYLALTDGALYELTGDTDDGVAIESIIKTGLINFGSAMKKSMPRAYFGYTSNGEMLFKTITTDTGRKVTRWYQLKERTAESVTDARVKMARGVKSVYWQFEITNIEGADFDVNDIKLLPVILNRRV